MKKRYERIIPALLILCIALSSVFLLHTQKVTAAETSVTIHSVVYSEESLYVYNGSNTKLFFATEVDAAKGNWDVMNVDPAPLNYTVIDLSWLSPNVDNIIMVKGDVDKTPKRVIIKEDPRKLEIAINYANINSLSPTSTIATLLNVMSTEGNAEEPIDYADLQWKKGTGGDWQDSATLTVAKLEKYLIKGTYLYFRIEAKNDTSGNPDGTQGRRYSSEVALKIAKKSSPMVVGIDGEEFTADIKYGKEYRVTAIDGTELSSAPWIKVTDRSVKSLTLSKVLNKTVTIAGVTSLIDGTIADKAFPAMDIEIRDYATNKSAASKITEISLPAQRKLIGIISEASVPASTTVPDPNVYINYNGTKTMNITIPTASSELPYEYCIIKPDDIFEMDRATWSSITKPTEVKVLASKAVDGGTLYVRQKEIKSKAATRTSKAVDYALASTYLTKGIKYPSVPKIAKENYTFTKGYSSNIVFTITLNEKGRKPFETEIKSIKLGTKDIEFVDPPTTTTDADGVKTMTVILKEASLKAMTNCYNRAVTINYMNGTVDKTSIKLTIQSPTPAATLAATPAPGANAGTVINVVTAVGTGNTRVYVISDAEITGKNTQDTVAAGVGDTFTAGDDIPSINSSMIGKYITVYEVTNDTNRYIVKYKSIKIEASIIK